MINRSNLTAFSNFGFIALPIYAILVISLVSTPVFAQDDGETIEEVVDDGTITDAATQSTEGIVGDVDKGRRAPVLTFSTSIAADGSSAKILADTQIINEQFRKYPISVDFYVNGKLFSKQFRSLELPAPLGIDVPKELAAVPFNYSIVATLLHPNRQYVTVAQGAVTNNPAAAALSCTATETVGTDATGLVVTATVGNEISSENEFSFTLTDGDKSAVIELEVEASSSTTSRQATGKATIQQADTDAVDYELSGSVTASGTTVSEVDVSSAAGELVVSCESIAIESAAINFVGDEILTDSAAGDLSALDSVMNAPTSGTSSEVTSLPNADGVGPRGEPNFIPLDKVGGVEVVN